MLNATRDGVPWPHRGRQLILKCVRETASRSRVASGRYPRTGLVKRTALINSGAGIPSRFYDRFAAFLAQNGVPTLVYDYRGIGRTRPTSLRGFKASVEEWGSKDCAAVLDWLRDRFPGAERMVVGHSLGGFVTGFVTNGTLIDKMLLVSAHTGYWRDYATGAHGSRCFCYGIR